MGEIVPSNSSTPQPQQQQFLSPTAMSAPRAMPVREDCWSEDATFTLIEAWGKRYVDLNRGNLRQKQWQEVADTVNARHGHIKKARRTDVQCKNRIDTLKKKYKIEKARVLETNGSYKSPWPFFLPLDHLIGTTIPLKKLPVSASLSPPFGVPIHQHQHHQFGAGATINPNVATMRTPNLGEKRRAVSMSLIQSPAAQGEEYFRRNYAAVAAAAAREGEQSEDESEDEEEDEEEEEAVGAEVEGRDEDGQEDAAEERDGDGIRKLARVIEKFGEVYARVERDKQRQLIELEKQRMQFAKEMECQRMQMLVEMQVQLEKIKRAKRSTSDDLYS
ncbi:hypothetical protein RND81_08G000300 [Saponaria officinalis]|uniref:Myb/SANT-like DNA-binding domain-containing protein n=1 Tax=Saponaria officinalis TaxID=3572 RepID=A0AAW1J1L8_SAPOF